MKHYLCKYNFNWADEADFEGIELIDEETHKRRLEIQKLINEYKVNPEIILCFGSNQDDYFKLSEVVDSGKVIAEESYNDIKNLVCNRYDSFGFVPYLSDTFDTLFDRPDIIFNRLNIDLKYDVKLNPDKLNEDDLNEIEFYQKLHDLIYGI